MGGYSIDFNFVTFCLDIHTFPSLEVNDSFNEFLIDYFVNDHGKYIQIGIMGSVGAIFINETPPKWI